MVGVQALVPEVPDAASWEARALDAREVPDAASWEALALRVVPEALALWVVPALEARAALVFAGLGQAYFIL